MSFLRDNPKRITIPEILRTSGPFARGLGLRERNGGQEPCAPLFFLIFLGVLATSGGQPSKTKAMTLLMKIALVFCVGLVGGGVCGGNLFFYSAFALFFGGLALLTVRAREGFLLLAACLCGASASVSSARQVVFVARDAAALDPGETGILSGVVQRVERRQEGGVKIL